MERQPVISVIGSSTSSTGNLRAGPASGAPPCPGRMHRSLRRKGVASWKGFAGVCQRGMDSPWGFFREGSKRPIPTSLCPSPRASVRSGTWRVVSSGDAVISIGGAFGTLSEIGFALKLGKPVIALNTWSVQEPGAESPLLSASDSGRSGASGPRKGRGGTPWRALSCGQ